MAHSKSEIKKAKNLLNKYAPKGEQLAYINAKESKLLIKKGGAGKMTKTGIRSYEYEHDGANVSESGGPTGNTDTDTDTGGSGDDWNYTPAPTPLNADTARLKDTRFKGSVALWIAEKVGRTFSDYNKMIQGRSKKNDPLGLYAEGNFKQKSKGVFHQSDGNQRVAKNVGGRIVKLSPTTAEVSQSKAIDAAAYDNRKTKAKGRSMTILKRNVADSTLILGKKSLLGM